MLTGPVKSAISGNVKELIVLLHGYGADGNDLIGLAEPLAPVFPDCAFVSPNAPEPCRINPMGRQWFPVSWLDDSSEEEMHSGFHASAEKLDAFLTAQLGEYGLPASQVALVGFSQGTMMSLQVGMRREEPFAGIVGFSGRLLQPETLEEEITARPPVLLVHGDADPTVPYESMAAAAAGLTGASVRVHTVTRPGLGHGIDIEGITYAAQFLREAFAGAGGKGSKDG